MITKALKNTKNINKVCLSLCLTFSLSSCQIGETASGDISAIKNIIEQDAERAYQQKIDLEMTIQISFANNTIKYNQLINNYYKNLNENTNFVLDLIEIQRDILKNGNNIDKNLLLNSIGELQKHIDKVYEEVIRETGFYNNIEKERANTNILKLFTNSYFNNFDKSSNEARDLILTKLASDIVNTEITVTTYIYNAYKNSGCTNAVIVVPEKTEYKVGENYEANIYFTTKDTTKPADIVANGLPVKDGHLVIPCTKTGENTVEGSYTIKKDDRSQIKYEFQSKYKVSK